ncbi:TetR family transcriptional regulator [Nocardioides sp. Root1257]|uniref:TetR/AcrR family transcriptional regulator n=1 Tax=unclassified Nocardioides TaxID=2615069 RepID=UPI0006F67D0C|nr:MULTISPECIES: TetR/AcrR family transcriptional regulator [unclassified Nocardioides]KQW48786.1 TetR family transcriptional regulator [Nocardioides sp. Root1257]KRC47961.1 TetR family transcriptional regulator [Nocardioides sp. Root224]
MPVVSESSPSPDARTRLARAAVEAFSTRGFHGTTTRDISTAAGMSPAALYVHHRSKEELLFELAHVGHLRVLEMVRASVATSDDPVEQLGTLVEDFVRDHALVHTGARVINYELAALSAEHLAEVVAIRHDIDEVVRDVIDRGVGAGVFVTPDPHMTALAVLSLGIDVARWFRDEGRWSPDEVAVHYRLLALRMVGAVG